MKRLFAPILLAMALVLLTSCQGVHFFGKNSVAIAKQGDRIQAVEDKQSALNKSKIEDMTVLALGTDYALGKETNASRTVTVAREINQRVISEGGYSPTIDQIKEMHTMIDNLVASNTAGLKALQAKDLQIAGLQAEEKALVTQKDNEIKKFQDLAAETAQTADDTQNELNKYTAYWGLGAIFLGLKTLFFHLLWATIIFVVLFIILRAFALTNPFAAAIFGIFQSIGATVIHLIEMAIPSSIDTLNMAINDAKVVSDSVNSTIMKSTPVPPPATPMTGSAPVTGSLPVFTGVDPKSVVATTGSLIR